MILLPKEPKIIEKKDNWACFEIESLYPGYGITIGNSLRRVLLSSLPGAAVTQVKIKGVQHEFSTIPGVLEDIVVIMMNLKQMRFKIYSSESQKAFLKIKGEKQVKGSDFDCPSQVELVNKSCHIATLTNAKAELEMEIQISQGIGYEPVEERKKNEKLEIGTMPIDAIFTPVKKVSYQVENMRVGERTDFDRLRLEIETDGTLTPEQAFEGATEILINHFSLFRDSFTPLKKEQGDKLAQEENKKEDKLAAEQTNDAKTEKDPSKTKIEDLGLSARILKALSDKNIKNIKGILKQNEAELLEFEGIGAQGIKEIKKVLKKLGLKLESNK
jgi:DNA-directed RNA polymerase subunit alpha